MKKAKVCIERSLGLSEDIFGTEEEEGQCQGHQQVWIFQKLMESTKCKGGPKDIGGELGVGKTWSLVLKQLGWILQIYEQA